MEQQLLTHRQWMSIIRWTLYSVLLLAAMLLQDVVLPRIPIGGICMCCVPVCIACVSVQEEAETAALFTLIGSIFYCLSGIDCGPLYVFTLPFSAILAGQLCVRYTTKGIVSSLIMSLLSLTVCETIAFLYRVYIGKIAFVYWQTVLLPEILLSLLTVPLFYLGAWAIAKIGR